MAKKVDDLRDFQAQQAAYLRRRHKMRHEEIGMVLDGLSQSQVSRLLARAEQKGWLVTELRFVEAGIAENALDQIRHLLEPQILMRALGGIVDRAGGHVPHVAVFDSGSEATTMAAMDMRRRRLGQTAAGRLDELLQDAQKIGLAWGWTVSGLASPSCGAEPRMPTPCCWCLSAPSWSIFRPRTIRPAASLSASAEFSAMASR